MNQTKIQLTLEQALLLLRDGELGVQEWNEHCAVGHGTSDLSGAELNGAKLQRVTLAGVNLSGARLKQADLYGAELSQADLTDADLREAHLSEANLEEASLIQANLNLANLMGAKLAKAKLSYASCVRSNLIGADLSGASLNRTELSGADLLGATLGAAKLGGADLSGANLQGADLSDADLSEACLAGANLSRADLSGAHLEGANLEGALLDGASLNEAVIERTLFDADLDLLLFDWEHINVDGTRFTRRDVEAGDQTLPRAKPPLRISFPITSEVTGDDLRALHELVQSEAKPKGTSLYLALTETGSELVVEGRGSLQQAGLLGAMLFALPSVAGADQAPDPEQASRRHPLGASLKLAPPGLLACAQKLNQVYVRPRARAELERFERLIEKYGTQQGASVSERVVRLSRGTQAVERILLGGLGFEQTGSEQAGAEHAGFEHASFEQTGFEQTGSEQAPSEQTGAEPAATPSAPESETTSSVSLELTSSA